MRIGTWNVAGRQLGPKHCELLNGQEYDVWLLTEFCLPMKLPDAPLAGYSYHCTQKYMVQGRHWAAILSRSPLTPLPDPHPATAAAIVDGLTFWSSILPWRSCGSEYPWEGSHQSEKTHAAIELLKQSAPVTPLVWGGDWNHSLHGEEHCGSYEGREHLKNAIKQFNLQVPTENLPSRSPGCLSIDHIAVPNDWTIKHAKRIDTAGLSDHDAYVVAVDPQV